MACLGMHAGTWCGYSLKCRMPMYYGCQECAALTCKNFSGLREKRVFSISASICCLLHSANLVLPRHPDCHTCIVYLFQPESSHKQRPQLQLGIAPLLQWSLLGSGCPTARRTICSPVECSHRSPSCQKHPWSMSLA